MPNVFPSIKAPLNAESAPRTLSRPLNYGLNGQAPLLPGRTVAVPPAPVGAGFGRQQSNGSGGGGGFRAGFSQQPWNGATNENGLPIIDATPGDPAALNANPHMGMLDPAQFPLMGSSFAQREANAAPGAFSAPNSPLTRMAYGGGGVHSAIVGDPQKDGLPNPEVVTSASPIHVMPMKNDGRGMPHFAYGTQPDDAPLGVFPAVKLDSGDSLSSFGDNRWLYDANGKQVGKGSGFPSVGQAQSDAPPPAPVGENSGGGKYDWLRGGSNDAVPSAAPIIVGENHPATANPRLPFGDRTIASIGPATSYENEQPMRAQLAANKGQSDLPNTSPYSDQENWGGGDSPLNPNAPASVSAQPEPIYGAAAPMAPSGGDGQAVPPAPVAFNPPAPNALQVGNAARAGGAGVPPAPQMGMIADPEHNPMDIYNRNRNPMREERAVRQQLRAHPLLGPQMDMQREIKRQEVNRVAEKFNAEQLSKQIEEKRRVAHNVSQEQHWDDTIKGRNAVETAKFQETARKEHEKKMEENKNLSDALAGVDTRLKMLKRGEPQYKEKLDHLNFIHDHSGTAKQVESGLKHHDEIFPTISEINTGGVNGAVIPYNFRVVQPHEPAKAAKSKNDIENNYYAK